MLASLPLLAALLLPLGEPLRGDGTFSGRVVDASGTPRGGVLVTAYGLALEPPTGAPSTGHSTWRRSSARTRTEANGRFLLPHDLAEPIDVVVRLNADDSGAATDLVAIAVGLRSGKRKSGEQLDFQLAPEVPLRGRVLDPSGLPLAGLQIGAWPADSDGLPGMLDAPPFLLLSLARTATKRDGSFELRGLPAGDYVLRGAARPFERAVFELTPEPITSPREDLELTAGEYRLVVALAAEPRMQPEAGSGEPPVDLIPTVWNDLSVNLGDVWYQVVARRVAPATVDSRDDTRNSGGGLRPRNQLLDGRLVIPVPGPGAYQISLLRRGVRAQHAVHIAHRAWWTETRIDPWPTLDLWNDEKRGTLRLDLHSTSGERFPGSIQRALYALPAELRVDLDPPGCMAIRYDAEAPIRLRAGRYRLQLFPESSRQAPLTAEPVEFELRPDETTVVPMTIVPAARLLFRGEPEWTTRLTLQRAGERRMRDLSPGPSDRPFRKLHDLAPGRWELTVGRDGSEPERHTFELTPGGEFRVDVGPRVGG